MTAKTHMIVGVLCGAAYATATRELDLAVIAAGVSSSVVGSLVPDIDHHSSKISQKNIATTTVSKIVSALTSHRGIVHSLWFCIFASVAFRFLSGVVDDMLTLDISRFIEPCTIYFFIGCVSHLIADTFNRQGINWLPPITRKKFRVARILTGSYKEYIFLGVVFGLLVSCCACYVYMQREQIPELGKIISMVADRLK